MAGGFQYAPATHFYFYNPAASSEAAGFPATNLRDWDSVHPIARSWHSTSLLAQAINFDFGGFLNGFYFALMGANFSQVRVLIYNGSFFEDIDGGGGAVTRTMLTDWQDPEGYTKLWLGYPYTASQGRIEIPAQTTLDNLPYYSVGLVIWGTGLRTFSRNLQAPLVEEYVDPEHRVIGKDWTEGFPAGIRYKTTAPRQLLPYAEVNEWHQLRLIRPDKKIIVFFNLDNSSETYIWQRNRPVTVSREGVTQEVNTGFRTLA